MFEPERTPAETAKNSTHTNAMKNLLQGPKTVNPLPAGFGI